MLGGLLFTSNSVLRCRRFELILRNIKAESEEAVAAAAEGLRRTGFVNYYGLQRFGTGAVPTHRCAVLCCAYVCLLCVWPLLHHLIAAVLSL